MKKFAIAIIVITLTLCITSLVGCDKSTDPNVSTLDTSAELPTPDTLSSQDIPDTDVDIEAPELNTEDTSAVKAFFLSNYLSSSSEDVYEKVSQLGESSFSLRDGILFHDNTELSYPLFVKVSDSMDYAILYLSDSGYVKNYICHQGGLLPYVPEVYNIHDIEEQYTHLAYTELYSIVYDEIMRNVEVWSFNELISSFELPINDEIVYCGYSQYGYLYRNGTRLIALSESNDEIPTLTPKVLAENIQLVLDSNYYFSSDWAGQILLLTTSGEVKVYSNGELVDPLYEGSYNSRIVKR